MHQEPAPTSSHAPESPVGPGDGTAGGAGELVKCVWSGYPNYDDPCRSRIPIAVVVEAWEREMTLNGTLEGFFHISWSDGVWLAYGLRDGGVRGVYCPDHRSERDARHAHERPASTEITSH